MKVTAINNLTGDSIVFTWNEDLTECKYVAFGEIEDKEIDLLIQNNVHSGCDWCNWTTEF